MDGACLQAMVDMTYSTKPNRLQAGSCNFAHAHPAEAERLILENVAMFHREDAPLTVAHRRMLRTELRADRDLPPFDRVTMDGYAIRATSLAAGTRVFRVEGLQAAGMRAFKLGATADACLEV